MENYRGKIGQLANVVLSDVEKTIRLLETGTLLLASVVFVAVMSWSQSGIVWDVRKSIMFVQERDMLKLRMRFLLLMAVINASVAEKKREHS